MDVVLEISVESTVGMGYTVGIWGPLWVCGPPWLHSKNRKKCWSHGSIGTQQEEEQKIDGRKMSSYDLRLRRR